MITDRVKSWVTLEEAAQLLHVGDQVPGRVVLEARVRTAAAATALVEQHDAVDGRIEIAAHRRAASAPRPAVQDDDRDAVRVSALFDIQAVARARLPANIDQALIEGVDRRVKEFDCALLA